MTGLLEMLADDRAGQYSADEVEMLLVALDRFPPPSPGKSAAWTRPA
jgi:hypothetical protein